jgi:hypothetical protein
MTAFATKLTTATFSNALKGLRLPNRRKLVGEYVFGDSEAESIKNRANPSAPLTVQGTSTYNANSVIVRSSATVGFGFLTGIKPADDATLIVIRKNPTIASQPEFIGTRASSQLFGIREFGGNIYGSNGESSLTQGASRTKPSAGSIFFEAVVLSRQNPQLVSGGYGKLYYYSSGQQVATSATVNPTGRRSIAQVCIGSTSLTDSITTNNLEIYFVAIYQRTLSSAEIDAAYQALVTWYAGKGITVI